MTSYPMAACLVLTLVGTSNLSIPASEGHSKLLFFDDSKVMRMEYPSWLKTSFMELRDDLAEARDDGKMGLMLLFETNGCAYCKAFITQSLSDPVLKKEVRENFDVIALNMFSDIESTGLDGQMLPVKDFAVREGATVAPTIIFVGTDGSQLLRLRGYQPPPQFRLVLDYLVGGHFETTSLRAYVAEQIPSGLAPASDESQDSLARTIALNFNRRIMPAKRPLLVFFGSSDWPECEQHRSQVLTYPPVSKQLSHYDTTRFDWLDERTLLVTPQGRRSNPADWARALEVTRVPTMIFFDECGQEVFRLESQVLRQRMERALLYVLKKAYADGTTYQQFTRARTIEALNAEEGSPNLSLTVPH